MKISQTWYVLFNNVGTEWDLSGKDFRYEKLFSLLGEKRYNLHKYFIIYIYHIIML